MHIYLHIHTYINTYTYTLTHSLTHSQIHANCRIRRVYFCDRLYSESELPAEFKLYLPVTQKAGGAVGAPVAAPSAE